ncbi:MAG TPA: S53 family peptidase, partial [Kofleriaceae bacterium]
MHTRPTIVAIVLATAALARAEPRRELRDQLPAWASASTDLGRIADQPLEHLTVWLARSPDRERAFAELRRDQETPGSASYHKWLTPAQIGERFGASDADLAAMTAWLHERGFAVRRVANARSFIELAGTARIAEAAFGVELHRFELADGTSRIALDREPSMPARLAPLVDGITGLVETVSVADVHVDWTGSDGKHYVMPADFAAIYDQTPIAMAGHTGAGQTIGIIGRSRVLASDITQSAMLANATIPQPTIIVPPAGVDPGAPCTSETCTSFSDNIEALIDVLRAGSTAPSATLDLIVSKSTATEDGVVIALTYAIDTFGTATHANIVSVSFDECESKAGAALTSSLDALYQQAAAQGQTVLVCSGDSGAAMCDTQFATPPATQVRAVNAFCSSAAVTCVGGTEFNDGSADWSGSGAALGYIPEGAWNEPGTAGATTAASTGGGTSTLIALPPYQASVAPTGITHRMTPDVAFSASGHDSYYGYLAAGGGDGNFYGTSAAAPSMAAVMAIVDEITGENQGAANTTIYALAAGSASPFHDVTVASSGVVTCTTAMPSMCNNSLPGPSALTGGLAGYAIGPGYDLATGWGSPDIAAFIASWPGAVAHPMLALGQGEVSLGAGQSATVTLTPSGFLTAVSYACSGTPDDVACSFGSDGLTVSSSAAPGNAAGALALGFGGMLVLALLRRARRGALGLVVVASCAGNLNGAPSPDAIVDAPATATITVIATGGGGET